MNWALDLNFLASQNLQWNSASCLSLMVTPPPPPGPGPSPDTFLMLPAPPCHEAWSHWTLGTVYCKGVGSDQVVTVLLVSRLRVTVTPAAAQCTVYKPHISDTTLHWWYVHTTQTLQKTRIQDLLYTVVTLYTQVRTCWKEAVHCIIFRMELIY